MEVNILNKTLSIIYADTYDDSWGSTIEVFGIADNEEDVKAVMQVIATLGAVLYSKGYLTEEEVKAILELKYDKEK